MEPKSTDNKPTNVAAKNSNTGSPPSNNIIIASTTESEAPKHLPENESTQNDGLRGYIAPNSFAAESAVVENCSLPSWSSNDPGVAAALAAEPSAVSQEEANSATDIQAALSLQKYQSILKHNVASEHGSASEQSISENNCMLLPSPTSRPIVPAAKSKETVGEMEFKFTSERKGPQALSENRQFVHGSGETEKTDEALLPSKEHETPQNDLCAKVPTTKMAMVENPGNKADSEGTKIPSMEEEPIKTISPKVIKYIGIRSQRVQQHTTFRPCVKIDKKTYFLGSYKLQADAARVFDAANERAGKNGRNFASAEHYHAAREKEIKETGIRVDIGEVVSYGRKRMTKFMKLINKFKSKCDLEKKPKFIFSLEQYDSEDKPKIVSNQDPPSLEEKLSSKSEKDPQYVGFVLEKGAFIGYRGHITYQRKCYKLGKYELQADAARAYDLAAEKLGRDHRNFDSDEDYQAARASEMTSSGSIVDFETADSTIRKNVEHCINSIPKPIILSTWKKSKYIGVHHLPNRQKPHQTCIHHEAKRYLLGCYRLTADAARAYDEAAKKLRKKVNFSTDADYLSEREREMEETGIHVDIEEARKVWIEKTELMLASIVRPVKQMVQRKYKFIGIYRSDNESSKVPYRSKVKHKKKIFSMGSYTLAADAARAFDEAAKLLRKHKMNFESEDHHIIARECEMDEVGLRVDLNEARWTWRKRLAKLRELNGTQASETVSAPVTAKKIKEDLFGIWCSDGNCQTKRSEGKDIEGAKANDCQLSPELKPKTSHPKQVGFVREKGTANRYRASISYHAKSFDIGRYRLQADAARAYDLAAEKLGRDHRNFNSVDEYRAVREKEMTESGIQIDFDKVDSAMRKKVAQLKEPLQLPLIPSYHKERRFVGVQYRADRPHVPFRSVIHHEGKKHPVGYFKLATDAARAYDEAAKKIGKDVNFKSEAEYLTQREHEMEETETRVDFKEAQGIMEVAATQFLKRLVNPKAIDHRKKFNFIGIRQCDNENSKAPFRARLRHNNKSYTMGCYKLATDAARAYDVIAKFFQKDKFNFKTEDDYIDTREREMEKVGFPVDLNEAQDTWKRRLEKVRRATENQEYTKKRGTQPVTSEKKKGEYLGVWCPDGDVPDKLPFGQMDIKGCIYDDQPPLEKKPIGDTGKKTSLKRRCSRGQADEARKTEAINHDENQSPPEKKQRTVKKSSNVPQYVGVTTEQGSLEWHLAVISYLKQRYELGKYQLRADAARAYDMAAEQLGRCHRNFSSIEDYHITREMDMVNLGSHVDFQQVDSYMRKKVKGWIDSQPKPIILSDWKKRKYVGVQSRPDRPLMPYRTCIHKDGKKHPVGYYKLAADAARAYDEAARVFNKVLNFKSEMEYLTERENEMEEMGSYVDIQEAKDMWTKSAELFRERLVNPKAKFERKKCKFIGVFIIGYESKIPYRPRLRYKDKSFSMGCYQLAADAARAYDEMAKLLKKEKLNFENEDDYITAREREMKEVGFRVELKEVQENWPAKLEKMREELQNHEVGIKPVASGKKKREYLGVWRPSDDDVHRSKYFSSMIVHNNVTFLLGSYALSTDAARAHDKAARILCKQDVNFRWDEEYHVARNLEMKELGIHVDLNEVENTLHEILKVVHASLSGVSRSSMPNRNITAI